MIQINNKKQHGFFTSDLTTAVIWAILVIISLILTVLFAMTLIESIKEFSTKSTLSEQENIIAMQVTKNVKSVNKLIEDTISSSMTTYDGIHNEPLIDSIKQKLPQALRVLISNQELTEIIPTKFPGINYATLDMLKNTQKTNKNPIAEIHLFGQQNQYLNFVKILNNEQSSYLIISLPTDEILKKLANPTLTEGRLVLIQRAGKFSKVSLKSWGSIPKNSGDTVKHSQDISGSYFSVNYAYASPKYLLKDMTKLSALVGMLSSILLLVAVLLNIILYLLSIHAISM